jgi:hypothetical protein
MEGDFVKALDEAAKNQGESTSDETEAAKFMAGLNELIIGNPGLFLSKENIKLVVGNVIGKWMPEGICVLPSQTLNVLDRIKIFTQIPTVESMTMALDRENLLIHDNEGRNKYQIKINGGKTRGWYIRLNDAPSTGTPYPLDGDHKTLPDDPGTPVPVVPDENERQVKKEKFENGKLNDIEKDGYVGTSKEKMSIDIDIVVPEQYPTRTRSTQEDTPKSGKNEMETPIGETNLIRQATVLEHGLKGWIDARIVANKLKIPLDNVVNYLKNTHLPIENQEFGYKQK